MEHKDKRLERIRLYKGSIQDLVDFIKDKEKETKAETAKPVEPTKPIKGSENGQ